MSERRKSVACIRITPYLAEYAVRKFHVDERTGAICIPDTSDLYHVVWNGMTKPRRGDIPEEGNLQILLPKRREGKNPAYYNKMSSQSVKAFDHTLRIIFNFEYHHFLLDHDRRGSRKNIIALVARGMGVSLLMKTPAAYLTRNAVSIVDLEQPIVTKIMLYRLRDQEPSSEAMAFLNYLSLAMP